MSLYIVYTSDIRKRQANTVFFFHSNKCLCLENNAVSKPLFDIDFNCVDSYKKVVEYAEDNKLVSYEIFINNESLLRDVLEFLSDYLLDKDLSIGLLTDNDLLIKANEELISTYGANYSIYHPFFEDEIYEITRSKAKLEFAKPIVANRKERVEVSSPSINKKKSPGSYRPKVAPIELEESFHDKFLKFLIESGKDNVEIYKAAGISKQVFSKILSDKDMIPTKLTVVSLCIGLRLTLRDSKELMLSAGYSLSRSLIFDSIIIKYLKDEIYDFDLINSELNEYGCPILGWHPREK